MKPAATLICLAAVAVSVMALPPIHALPGPTNSPRLLFQDSNSVPVARCDERNSDLPRPGVYETHPYTCILIVPGSTGDNCVLGGGAQHGMPTYQPKVKIVPRQ